MAKLRVLRIVPVVVALVAPACGTEEVPESRAPNPDALGRFQHIDLGTLASSSFVPRSLGSRRETFIVKLSGDPVAAFQAKAVAKLRSSEKLAVRDQLAIQQNAVASQIAALGGDINARYSDAYNGLRIQIDSSQIAQVRSMPGVMGVYRPKLFRPNNIHGVPLIEAPAAWAPFAGVDGVTGQGVKIAIIDTGIDYTHADFGGPGTPDAFNQAFAASTLPADPTLFGPESPKVKGGIDLVGDDYDASQPETDIPVQDPNPLDCFGHGSHVAGTAAGFGVLADGTTFHGSYDSTTITANSWNVAPGVAPQADLYAVRVFGCVGSTNLVVDAIDWAVANDMDVVNMSLGGPFGSKDDPDAEACDNASKAGVIIVAADGNDGDFDYITGSPAASSTAISVAALDPTATFPGAVATSGPVSFQTINANAAPLSGALPVKVLLDAAGNVSLGCDPADYVDVVGQIAVVKRGTCARVARAVYGEQAGAGAVLMINNEDQVPPFEGQITFNPDTGESFTVTIPFLGTSQTNEATVRALDGQSLSLASNEVANPDFEVVADFSSKGPRLDAHLKPEVTAPGVNIVSVAIGSGNGGTAFSGTSMATPHTAGLAALARQAHPTWSVAQLKTAIVNTANPANLVAYSTRRDGSGLVDAADAVHTNVIAWADPAEVHLNLGFLEQKTDYVQTKLIRIRNRGTSAATFNLTAENPQGSPHVVALSPTTVTVPPENTIAVNVTFTIDTATSGDSSEFRDLAGVVVFTPAEGSNNGVALRVPYYSVLRPSANVVTALQPRLGPHTTQSLARVTNNGSELAATADFYEWGLSDPNEQLGPVDIRAAGVQSFATPTGPLVVFAVNMYKAWSAPSLLEVDIPIDTDLDGVADFVVFAIDLGLLSPDQTFSGQIASAVQNLVTGEISVVFLAVAPTNSSTVLLPVDGALQLGLTEDSPRFAYSVQTFDLFGADTDATDTAAIFNAFTSSVSQGDFVLVEPNQEVSVPVSLDPVEQAVSQPLGHMIVTFDNHSGQREAQLIPLRN